MGTQWGTCPCPLPALPHTFPPGTGNPPGQGGRGCLGPHLPSCKTCAAHPSPAPPSLYYVEDLLVAALTPFLCPTEPLWDALPHGQLSPRAPTRAGLERRDGSNQQVPQPCGSEAKPSLIQAGFPQRASFVRWSWLPSWQLPRAAPGWLRMLSLCRGSVACAQAKRNTESRGAAASRSGLTSKAQP